LQDLRYATSSYGECARCAVQKPTLSDALKSLLPHVQGFQIWSYSDKLSGEGHETASSQYPKKKESLQRPLKSDIKELSLIVCNTHASMNRYLKKGT
jgi:hypothetical protein